MNLTGSEVEQAWSDLEKWQNNLLPSHQSGFIVLTTSVGIMDKEARQNTQEGKSWGSFSRDVNHRNKKPPWTVLKKKNSEFTVTLGAISEIMYNAFLPPNCGSHRRLF